MYHNQGVAVFRIQNIFSLHGSTRVALLLVIALFSWLNFDYSRDAYTENVAGAWRGGVRHGFPLTAWDGGGESRAAHIDGRMSLRMKEYGGWQFGGLFVDVLVLAAVLTTAGRVLETRARRTNPAAIVARLRGPALHLPVYPAIALSSAALLWANLDVRTRLVEFPDGRHDFYQEMGWPFRTYLASRPSFKPVRPPEKLPTRDEKLIYLQANPDAWYKQAHWYMSHIALNVVAGLALVLVVAGGAQYALRSKAKIKPVAVVLPVASD